MDFTFRGYRVGVFVDNVNLYLQCKNRYGASANHELLLEKAVAGNHLHRAIAYGVRFGDAMDRWRQALEQLGYEIREKEPVNGKADWDLAMVVDVWRMIDRLDMVVIVSGDGDFVPLIERCHELGKLVRVMGVEGYTSRALIDACDEFVPVTEADILRKESHGAADGGAEKGSA